MNSLFEGTCGAKVRGAVFAVLVALALFLILEAVQAFMGLRYIGAGIAPTNTITVSGEGDAYATPDIAEFSFSVVSDKATVAEAQADATKVANDITGYLTQAGVDEKDIKTTDYSIAPQYDYQNAVCPQVAPANGSSGVVYCPPSKQVLKGYEVRQSTQVKVRDTTKAGDLLAGIGTRGATEVSGLSFTVEDPNAVEATARDKAIMDAKTKAEELAKSLGVSLVRIVAFSENNGPQPVYGFEAAGVMSAKAAAPQISVGQNKVTSDVSVTYEIK